MDEVWADMEARAAQAAEYVEQARRWTAGLAALQWRSPAGRAFLDQLERTGGQLAELDGAVDEATRQIALGRVRALALRRLRDLPLEMAGVAWNIRP
jgi:hypothetical protein